MTIDSRLHRAPAAWPLLPRAQTPVHESPQDFPDDPTLNREARAQLIARAPFLAPERTLRFGRYIRALREARGWSRVALAQRARVHPVAVGLLEAGGLMDEETSGELVSRLADAFAIPSHQLACYPTAAVAAELRAAAPAPGRPVPRHVARAWEQATAAPPIDWSTLLRPAAQRAARPLELPAHILPLALQGGATPAAWYSAHRGVFVEKSTTAPTTAEADRLSPAAPGDEQHVWTYPFHLTLAPPDAAQPPAALADGLLEVYPDGLGAQLTVWVPDPAPAPDAAIACYGLTVSVAGAAGVLGPAAFTRTRRKGSPIWRARLEVRTDSAITPAALRAAAEANALQCSLIPREEVLDGR